MYAYKNRFLYVFSWPNFFSSILMLIWSNKVYIVFLLYHKKNFMSYFYYVQHQRISLYRFDAI